MNERVDHRETVDEDAPLRQYTFDVADFSRDLAAVTVRLDAVRARLVLRDLERLLARVAGGRRGAGVARGAAAGGAWTMSDERHAARWRW